MQTEEDQLLDIRLQQSQFWNVKCAYIARIIIVNVMLI